MYVCFVCVYHICDDVHGGQKRVLAPLELELQVIVSHYVGARILGPLQEQPVFLMLNYLPNTCLINSLYYACIFYLCM